jgi:tRNA (cytidine56-2'-O)-methyltransferase
MQVLRLGHRPQRDRRLTTHVCLTARAFGADAVLVDAGDPRVEETVEDVVERFGGPFELEMGVPAAGRMRAHDGPVVHLTMYGEPMGEVLPGLEGAPAVPQDLMVAVGAGKVGTEVYEAADRNAAVGHQPHSEVAALAVFLHALRGEDALREDFEGAEVRVAPQADGKQLEPVDGGGDGGEDG